MRPRTDRAPGHGGASLRRGGGLRCGAERGPRAGVERVPRLGTVARLVSRGLTVAHDRRRSGSGLVARLRSVAGLRPVAPVLAVPGRLAVAGVLAVSGVLAVPRLLGVPRLLAIAGVLAMARSLPVAWPLPVTGPLVVAGGLVVVLRLVVAGRLVVVLRLVVAGQASSPGPKGALMAADGPVAAGRLALLIALIVRSGAFGFGTGVPAPRWGVPTTHLCSIPRRCGRRLLVSARDPGVAGTAPDQRNMWRLHRNRADHGQYPQNRQATVHVGSG